MNFINEINLSLILSILVICFCAILIIKGQYALSLGIYCALAYWTRSVNVFGISHTWVFLATIILALLTTLLRGQFKVAIPTKGRWIILWSLFWWVWMLSLLVVRNPPVVINFYRSLILYIMIPLPIIVLFFNGPSKVKAFAMGFVATTLISGPVALFVIGISVSDLLLDPSLRSLGIIRLSIINYHWFSYSQVIAIILLLVISLYQKKLIIRIFCYLGVLVCGYFLLLIGSRQSIGAGVISIIILLILSMKFSTKKILPAFLLILCILGFGYYFLNNNLDLVLRPARGEEGLFDIFQLVKERGPYWEQGVRQFLQNPIFGAGYASDTNAHNLFIGVLADQGLVGMFFLFGFIFFFIQQGLRIRFRGDKQKFFWSIGILSIGIFGFIHGQASGTPISLWHVWWSAAMVWILNSNFHTLNGKTNLIVSNNEQA